LKFKTVLIFILFSTVCSISGTAQIHSINVSGIIKNETSNQSLPFVNVTLKAADDSTFITGTISNESGLFTLSDVKPNQYLIEVSYFGYLDTMHPLYIGPSSKFIDIGIIFIKEDAELLSEVTILRQQDAIIGGLDKKTFSVDDIISQSGGSVLQSITSLPGITTQDGKVHLRGNSQVIILIDGKQTAITGIGSQNGLDNIPASVIENIEIINNPSAKFDANGNAGIINIILKKDDQKGLNGKAGISTGIGALWVRRENLPGIRPQYKVTPKVNPALSLNYRRKKINLFIQTDNLYSETLNKNEFVTRIYEDGRKIRQQTKRNRNTNFFTSKVGLDWFINKNNALTLSGSFNQESIKDFGDQPFFDGITNESLRLWDFLEDEVLTAAMATIAYEHKFQEPGHKIDIGLNYTFDREDEKYFFNNVQSAFTTSESFFLIADQKVADFNFDYARPLKQGLFETGVKFRARTIPTDMQFNPSETNSVLDTGADGKATYSEFIPATYLNYIYEVKKLEAQIGIRLEYVELKYDVDPNHNTYQTNGYRYLQPFPNSRVTYKFNARNKISAFYNRRVDRPDEVDIRIFPKYDDAEIIKVGNPALQPQFTNRFEIGYKGNWKKGYFYGAGYHQISEKTITRIASNADTTSLIYNISQNAGTSYNTGFEIILSQKFSNKIDMILNINGYHNQIDSFTVVNLYPIENTFSATDQQLFSWNIKLSANFKFTERFKAQLTFIYLAPDIIPQGSVDARYSLDLGINKSIQKNRGALFINASDLLNSMVIRKEIIGDHFSYISANFYETQVIRFGYSYKF